MTSLEFSILTLNKTCKYGQFPLSFTIEREYKQEDRKRPVFEFLFLHINTYAFQSDSVLFLMLARSRGGPASTNPVTVFSYMLQTHTELEAFLKHDAKWAFVMI